MSAIGIDLGTSYTRVGVFRNGKVDIIANDDGIGSTSSYIAFTDSGRLFGDSAKEHIIINPKSTVFNVKRLIGRKYADTIKLQTDLRLWPFQVIEKRGRPRICVEYKGGKKKFAPEEILAMTMAQMKLKAEKHLGISVENAVIAVPTYFNRSQRQATKDSAAIAGLNVLRLLNEPAAAALAYGVGQNHRGRRNILIFDLGGGTFDASISTIIDGSLFEVRASAGNSRLGGVDFDNRLVDFLAAEIYCEFKVDLRRSPTAIRRLRSAVERAKRVLSVNTEATITIDALYKNIDFYTTVTRTLFERVCEDLFRRTIDYVRMALTEAKMDKSQIDDIVLVGGSTQMPKIRSMLNDFFDDKNLNFTINPNEAVTVGAAIQAAILSGNRIDPLRMMLVVEVIPLSLGVEAVNGDMIKIIDSNSRIPCTQMQTFTTRSNNQEVITVKVFEGDKPIAKDNNLLGTFDLKGISPVRNGLPKVDVIFNVNANGILTVTVKDVATGLYNNFKIKNVTDRLTNKEINAMIHRAAKFADEDKYDHDVVHARDLLINYSGKMKDALLDANAVLNMEIRKILGNKYLMEKMWLQNNSNLNNKKIFEEKVKEIITFLVTLWCRDEEMA